MFQGIYTALVTPFKNGDIDWPSLRRLVRFQIDQGIAGFVIAGTTGESPTLSLEEKEKIFRFVKAESDGSLPLIVGTGTNNTLTTVQDTQAAQKWGADGALVVVPYYNKPPQEGLVAHYRRVAREVNLPILLYNVPGRTGVSLSLESVVTLSGEKHIVGIKEATGDAEFSRKIVQGCHREFLVTSGDDGAYLKVYEAGGRGVISVLSHLIAAPMVKWAKAIVAGDTIVHQEFAKYMNLTNLLFSESNPIPVKAALKNMGIIDSNELRLPLVSMSGQGEKTLLEELKTLGLV